MRKIWGLITISLCVLLLTGFRDVSAAPAGERIPWKVEGIGTFYVPDGGQATVIEMPQEVRDAQKQMQATMPDLAKGEVNPVAKLNDATVHAYQLTMNDGNTYHLGWLVFVRDNKKMVEEEKKIFDREISSEQRAEIIALVQKMNAQAGQWTYEDPKTKAFFRLIEIVPVDFLKVNKKQAFGGGGRFLIGAQGFQFPLYVKGYMFNAKGHTAGAMLITFDGERNFWDPVVREVIVSLNRRP